MTATQSPGLQQSIKESDSRIVIEVGIDLEASPEFPNRESPGANSCTKSSWKLRSRCLTSVPSNQTERQ